MTEAIFCQFHPREQITLECSECNEPMCVHCNTAGEGEAPLCKSCAQKLAEEGAASSFSERQEKKREEDIEAAQIAAAKSRKVIHLQYGIIVVSIVIIAWQSLEFVSMSWSIREASPDPGGLPARYIIKAFVPLGFFLV